MKRKTRQPVREPIDCEMWLVEDNATFRDSIRELIEGTPGFQCTLAFSSCEEALDRLREDGLPDAMLMDIGLPGMGGIEGIRRIKSIAPSIQVIVLTVFDDTEKIVQAICAGASGYLLKSASPEKIIGSLLDIVSGGAPINAQIAKKIFSLVASMGSPAVEYDITPAEREILRLLIEGEPKKVIAHQLGVSFHTVDTHLRNIYTKLQVHSRSGAVAKALKERLV
jgi:DNA-binding NarL/FixJ family response regulator